MNLDRVLGYVSSPVSVQNCLNKTATMVGVKCIPRPPHLQTIQNPCKGSHVFLTNEGKIKHARAEVHYKCFRKFAFLKTSTLLHEIGSVNINISSIIWLLFSFIDNQMYIIGKIMILT